MSPIKLKMNPKIISTPYSKCPLFIANATNAVAIKQADANAFTNIALRPPTRTLKIRNTIVTIAPIVTTPANKLV